HFSKFRIPDAQNIVLWGFALIFVGFAPIFYSLPDGQRLEFQPEEQKLTFASASEQVNMPYGFVESLHMSRRVRMEDQKASVTYELYLESNNGAVIFLSEADQAQPLRQLATEILHVMLVDYYEYNQLKSYGRAYPTESFSIALPENSIVTEHDRNDATEFVWSARNGWLIAFGVVLIACGMIAVIYVVLRSRMRMVMYLAAGFIGMIAFLVLVSTLLFRQQVRIENNTVSYAPLFFTGELYASRMKLNDVHSIRIDSSGTDNVIVLLDKRAGAILERIKDRNGPDHSELADAALELFRGSIQIPATGLLFQEKLFIQQSIWKRVEQAKQMEASEQTD
ncbi:MAG: hypothetical protein KDK27_17460, partial [Leptospiraceae bacterium]|nr:hypothetical protein [Leptospiraceae bacterium]